MGAGGGKCFLSLVFSATRPYICVVPAAQEASKQLRVLQRELQTFVADGQALRQKHEAAEQR